MDCKEKGGGMVVVFHAENVKKAEEMAGWLREWLHVDDDAVVVGGEEGENVPVLVEKSMAGDAEEAVASFGTFDDAY